jgi:hypothetical protein
MRGGFLRTFIDGEERLGLAEMVARTHPDDCVFCGEKRRKEPTRPDITCGDEICRGSYHRFWRRDQRAAQTWAGTRVSDREKKKLEMRRYRASKRYVKRAPSMSAGAIRLRNYRKRTKR